MAPSQNCLQYFTSISGSIASFNWDTSAAVVDIHKSVHLSSQFYDICIRRARESCSICFTPHILSAADGTASSYGVGQSNAIMNMISAIGPVCTGITSIVATNAMGSGDYLEIVNMQPSTGTISAMDKLG